MYGILALAVIALILLAIPPIFRFAVAKKYGKQIGAKALAEQPDHIHLIRADDGAWKNRKEAAELGEALLGTGFEDAGTYTVDEMKGVVLRLFVRPADAWLATIYEHPNVGRWVEISLRFQGGGGFAVTSLPPNGLDDRPDFPIRRLPGVAPSALLGRMRAEKPEGMPESISVDRAAERFEAAYAEGIAWRKQHGISQREVVQVAMKQAA